MFITIVKPVLQQCQSCDYCPFITSAGREGFRLSQVENILAHSTSNGTGLLTESPRLWTWENEEGYNGGQTSSLPYTGPTWWRMCTSLKNQVAAQNFCSWFSGNFSESIYHKSFKSYKLYSSSLHNFLQILCPQSTLLIYADTPRFTTIQNKKQSNTMQHNINKQGGQILTKCSYNIFSELPLPTINHLACLRTVMHDVCNLWSVSYVVYCI